MHAGSNSEPEPPRFALDPRWEIPRELAACTGKALGIPNPLGYAATLLEPYDTRRPVVGRVRGRVASTP